MESHETRAARHDEFLRLACLRYDHSDHPSRWKKARELLDSDPSIATRSISAAAALGDASTVERCLEEDPSLAERGGGPHGWQPLLYAAYSRAGDGDYVRVAELLLDAGADPNAHWWWAEQYEFTAVTGAFGEGELGPHNQPPQRDGLRLARLLLERGADPNDSQALYNRMFRPGADCLRMLLEFGLGPEHTNNWRVHDATGALVANQETTLGYQLRVAAANGHRDRLELLASSGVDLASPLSNGMTPWRTAAVHGHEELAAFLADCGAEPEELTPRERLRAALLCGDAAAARAEDSQLLEALKNDEPELLQEMAGQGRLRAVRALVDFGFDVAGCGTGSPPLHAAAWSGHLDVVELLVERGAALDARDPHFDATPLGHAEHGGHRAVIDWLQVQR